MAPGGALFEQLLDALFPDAQGYVVALEAYFDESIRPSGVFCVAGLLFDNKGARAYSAEARRVFGPYGGFHMVDLVAGAEGYKGLSQETRDDLLKSAVAMANRHVLAGVTISCLTQDVEKYGPDFIRGFRDAYSILCHLSAAALGMWLRERWPGGCGGVAYFFESGCKYHGEADELLRNAERAAIVKCQYQYRSHVFASKADLPPLWAADLLAWEVGRYYDETVSKPKRAMRKSLSALLAKGQDESGHNSMYTLRHLTSAKMAKFLTDIKQLGLDQLQTQPLGGALTFDEGRLRKK